MTDAAPEGPVDRLRHVIEFVARMNPLALQQRAQMQERLTADTTLRAKIVLKRRMELLDAEKAIRTRQAQ